MAIIKCSKCGIPAEKTGYGQKQCSECGTFELVRGQDSNPANQQQALRTCAAEGCGKPFMLIQKKEKMFCGDHMPREITSVVGHCSWCERDNVVLLHGYAVCMGCATDPSKRKQLGNQLLEKFNERVAAHS